MDNYKIKVKDEAESKEAQELFFELGYEWRDSKRDITNLDVVFIYAKDGVLTAGFNDHNFAEAGHKELTLPQLRDLVVLKRGDVRDANYRSKKVSDGLYFKSCDGIFYFMFEGKWVQSEVNTDEGLEPITQDPALISGADALRALADGKEVQVSTEFTSSSWHDDTATYTAEEILAEETAETDDYNSMKLFFRLKPQTIKLELELPKPFEPKVGEEVFYINDTNKRGYCVDEHQAHYNYNFGVWRTESEIKQVVEQLRKIRGTNS